jgi:hypothetical protein
MKPLASHSTKGTPWKKWAGYFTRSVITLVLVACLGGAAREGLAAWCARKGTLEGIRHAEFWDSGDPEYPAEYVRALAANLESTDPNEMVRELEASTMRGPRRAINWANLGEAYELAGRTPDAMRVYERAVELFPKSPQINWQFANFLIRTGNTSIATEPLREAILGDPALRIGAFDIAWRAGIPPERVLEIVPARQDILSTYLDYLVQTGRLDAAQDAWNRLLASPEPFDLDAALRYFDALLRAHRVDKMLTVWTDLARHDPARIHWQPGEANLIQNGGFEEVVLNGGFDWRILPIEGAAISFDTMNAHDGTRSLVIRFDGKHNLGFGNVVQYVAVEPHEAYRFLAYARTEGITTDSGPRIAIYDPIDRRALSVETESLAGSAEWEEQRIDFRTGAETRLLAVQIVRPPGRKLDNQISGTMWLDDVSLTVSP